MATLTHNAETGASGTALNAVNSAGAPNTAFDAVVNNESLAYSNITAMHGGRSIRYPPTGTAVQSYAEWAAAMGAQSQIWSRFYVRWDGTLQTDTALMKMLSGTSTQCLLFRILSTGKFQLLNAANAQLFLAGSAASTNTWYRVECSFGFSTTVGTWDVRIYAGDSASTSWNGSGSAANLGAATADHFRFIHPDAGAIGASTHYYFDDFGLSSDTWIGVPTPALPPERLPANLAAVNRAMYR